MSYRVRHHARRSGPTRDKMSGHPFVRRLSISVALGCALPTSLAKAADEPLAPEQPAAVVERAPTVSPVDFVTDIQPILVAHCYKCHGGEQRRGGLKLDVRADAESGGDSGKPILGGTLETNELYLRVSSPDRSYRMPKNAEALSEHEIERIRRWVEQGAGWSEPSIAAANQSKLEWWLEKFGAFADRYQSELGYALPYGLAFVVAQIAILAVARCGRAYQNGSSWATGRTRRFGAWCQHVKPRELALVWLLMGASLGLVVMRGHQRKLDRELAQLRTQRSIAEDPWTRTIWGSPPKPIRLDEPKQISGTYYRGNCERSPQLFNGGNYLTAIFRIGLCDKDHRPLALGDQQPAGGVYLRMELERAPGTADGFFSKEMIASVFLSREFYHNSGEPRRDSPARLETLEDAKRWVAYLPLGPREDPRMPLGGVIYVYTGRIEKDTVRGDPQYGIVYDLHFVDDRLTDDSDLWMSALSNPVFDPPRQFDKLPFEEWFDYRPIPAITGENSTDPKILGLDEYVKKGLIPPQPPAAPTTDSKPASDEKPVKGQSDPPTKPAP